MSNSPLPQVIRTPAEMTTFSRQIHRRGGKLGLVPTMGCLHEGHLSLVRLVAPRCDVKVASIFVNPIQFGKGEDLERYPRNEPRDLELLASVGCDAVFCPTPADMYPVGFQTYVEVEALAKPLCGAFRPGHFRGVVTVVLKLFNITACDVAAFGLKDYQQAMIIKRMVADLNLPVELVFGPTVRERDGLAMSSRNTYLNPEERRRALAVPRALEWARRQAAEGPRSAAELRRGVMERLTAVEGLAPQYVEVVHPETLEPVQHVDRCAVVAVAVYSGATRLIDNVAVGPDAGSEPICDL